MIGLYAFLFIFLYAFIFFKIAKWLATKVNGVIKKLIVFCCVIIIAFAALLGDHYFGMYKFNKICAKDSGLRVFEKRSKPDGILFETEVDEAKALYKMGKYGLKFVERRVGGENFVVDGKYAGRDKVARYHVGENGKIGKSIHYDYLSKYVVSSNRVSVDKDIVRRDVLVKDMANNKVLAAYYRYSYFGGWYVNSMLPRFGEIDCSGEPKYLNIEESIINSTFWN